MNARAAWTWLVSAGALLALGGCVSEEVQDSAVTVLTLRNSTMSDVRERRGEGPFQDYDVSVKEMLEVLEAAARRARGEGGGAVQAVFVSVPRAEVVAKERPADQAARTGYAEPFLSAMLAVVHAVPDQAERCRVEIHEIRSGPFHQGVVQWKRDMPGWIQEEMQLRAQRSAGRLRPIP